MRKVLMVVLAAAFAIVHGNVLLAVPVGKYYDYIYKVHVGDDNYLYINVKDGGGVNFSNDLHGPCSNPWYAKSKYPMSDDRTKAWLSLATASFLGRRKVYVTTDGCTADGRFVLVGIQLED